MFFISNTEGQKILLNIEFKTVKVFIKLLLTNYLRGCVKTTKTVKTVTLIVRF